MCQLVPLHQCRVNWQQHSSCHCCSQPMQWLQLPWSSHSSLLWSHNHKTRVSIMWQVSFWIKPLLEMDRLDKMECHFDIKRSLRIKHSHLNDHQKSHTDHAQLHHLHSHNNNNNNSNNPIYTAPPCAEAQNSCRCTYYLKSDEVNSAVAAETHFISRPSVTRGCLGVLHSCPILILFFVAFVSLLLLWVCCTTALTSKFLIHFTTIFKFIYLWIYFQHHTHVRHLKTQ